MFRITVLLVLTGLPVMAAVALVLAVFDVVAFWKARDRSLIWDSLLLKALGGALTALYYVIWVVMPAMDFLGVLTTGYVVGAVQAIALIGIPVAIGCFAWSFVIDWRVVCAWRSPQEAAPEGGPHRTSAST